MTYKCNDCGFVFEVPKLNFNYRSCKVCPKCFSDSLKEMKEEELKNER
jgi:predicted Zn-ribbon and HTH transcriptional regulator